MRVRKFGGETVVLVALLQPACRLRYQIYSSIIPRTDQQQTS